MTWATNYLHPTKHLLQKNENWGQADYNLARFISHRLYWTIWRCNCWVAMYLPVGTASWLVSWASQHLDMWRQDMGHDGWETQFLTRNLTVCPLRTCSGKRNPKPSSDHVTMVAIERERAQFLDTGTILDALHFAASQKIRRIALMWSSGFV